jgi:hypothetical protein
MSIQEKERMNEGRIGDVISFVILVMFGILPSDVQPKACRVRVGVASVMLTNLCNLKYSREETETCR